ncbi:MAG: macro domain-containing protein [Actinomycetota bacterium]
MQKVTRDIGKSILELTIGDITKQDTTAVVNAANSQLAPGGGVAGAIHAAAGPQLWEECKTLGGCNTGEAKITRGHRLPAEYIIHTVGPVYSNSPSDPVDLSNSYKNSLKLASEHNIDSISFPSLSTGAFGYPVEKAAEVALKTVIDYLENNQDIKLVRFSLFSQKDFEVYKNTLEKLT